MLFRKPTTSDAAAPSVDPTSNPVSALVVRAPRTPVQELPAAERPQPPQAAPAGEQQLIGDVKDVPKGRYVTFDAYSIPPSFAESFAFIQTAETGGVLLVTLEALRKPVRFDLERRLRADAGFKTIHLRTATNEIVRSLHEANKTVKVEEDTNTEEQAWLLIDQAAERGASDIHIETRGSFAEVFMRIHGERVRCKPPHIATSTAEGICGVLYTVHADGDNKATQWNPKAVQNTVIARTTRGGKDIQLRFSSAPIHPSGNFHSVIRILVMDEDTVRPLEDVGYTSEQVQAIEEMVVGSQGMVLVVGPTNSGKSTSMQSFVERIYDMRGRMIKVLTVEDPVEYIVRGACQMGVPEGRKSLEDSQSGSIYTTFLKGMLRQDPDVAMVGEIRDAESAEHVKQLVLAGRKLLTTLHVYEVYAVFARLRELGIPESVLYMDGFVSGVVCQRLVPVLCPQCSIPLAEARARNRIREATYERTMRAAGEDASKVRVRGDGCAHCNHMGIVGRTICAELLVPDRRFLELMSKGQSAAAREHWSRHSVHLDVDGFGVSMVAHAVRKMRQGLLDPSHIETHIGRIVRDEALARAGEGG